MGSSATAFGRGMLLGLGAALVYAAARDVSGLVREPRRADSEPSVGPEDRLIDWSWAERIAIRASGDAPSLHPAARDQLAEEYRTLLAEIEEPISAYTGTVLSLAKTRVEVMDRPGWIRANMISFRDLLQPIEEFYREQTDSLPPAFRVGQVAIQRSARLLLSGQMGILVGYLSRRVLGQYDISLLGKEPIRGGALYFVEPNLRHVEKTLGVPREEFRRWVALHEATHGHEFELHPWVREHMNTTLRTYMKLLTDDLRRQGGLGSAASLASRLAENLGRGHNLINALQTPRQRELLSRLQALMSLAEGYSNHVMNAVGRTLLPSFDLIHERVEHRQQRRSQVEILFLRITGLAMKMEQYKRGERFVDEVVRQRGIQFANLAWSSPDLLPTEAEIAEPAQWIARIDRQAA